MNLTGQIENYLEVLRQATHRLDLDAIGELVRLLEDCMDKDVHIYVFGNGGSASTASHMVCDMNKGVRSGEHRKLKFHCLNDSVSTLSAYSNDLSYDCVFEEQLKNFLRPQDVVIGISASGNSTNVINAIGYARGLGAKTVGITGYDGGQLKPLVDLCIHVPVNDMQKVEDMHLVIVHIVMQLLCGAEEARA